MKSLFITLLIISYSTCFSQVFSLLSSSPSSSTKFIEVLVEYDNKNNDHLLNISKGTYLITEDSSFYYQPLIICDIIESKSSYYDSKMKKRFFTKKNIKLNKGKWKIDILHKDSIRLTLKCYCVARGAAYRHKPKKFRFGGGIAIDTCICESQKRVHQIIDPNIKMINCKFKGQGTTFDIIVKDKAKEHFKIYLRDYKKYDSLKIKNTLKNTKFDFKIDKKGCFPEGEEVIYIKNKGTIRYQFINIRNRYANLSTKKIEFEADLKIY